jgi:hypothetical protein
MWALFGSRFPPQFNDVDDCLPTPRTLEREEAEETQAKLEAMQMADYREKLRAAVDAEKAASSSKEPGCAASNATASRSAPMEHVASDGLEAAVEKGGVRIDRRGTEHFDLDDEIVETDGADLDDMYDFNHFACGTTPNQPLHMGLPTPCRSLQPLPQAPCQGAACSYGDTPSLKCTERPYCEYLEGTCTVTQGSKNVWDADLRERLGRHVEELRERLGRRGQASLLDPLLEDLAAADAALAEGKLQSPNMQAEKCQPICTNCQHQPQEPPDFLLDGIDKNQVLELAKLTEELTDALELARSEAQGAKDELANSSRCLRVAERAREASEQTFAVVQGELEAARARVAEQEHQQAAERLRILLLERQLEERKSRMEFEASVDKALANRGEHMRFRHFEV